MAKLNYIKVWVKTRPGTELDVHRRRHPVDGDDELNLIVWSLFDPQDHDVTFNAQGFFEWLPPNSPPAGLFSAPWLSPDRKRILMEDLNPTVGGTKGDWDYKLRATGGDGTAYETRKGEEHPPGGGKPQQTVRALTATNPAIINR
jgi:hypothetical protein